MREVGSGIVAISLCVVFQGTAWADQAPPVSDYDEVASDFAAAQEPILVLGREAADLVIANQPAELFELFSAEFQQEFSLQQLTNRLNALHNAAPIGAQLMETAVPASPAVQLYAAEYVWVAGSRDTLLFHVQADENGEINDLVLEGWPPLPPDPSAGYESTTVWRLPFSGVWWVTSGGPTRFQNPHAVAPDQRHAFDISIWKNGGTHVGDGTANEDYGAFGQPLLAPADGTVETAVDGVPDNVPNQLNPAQAAGNHVVLRTNSDEYVLLAHFQQGSILVQVGDVVRAGDGLGRAGNSGNSFEPHLHIHAQDLPGVLDPQAVGLPIVFSNYEANGEAVGSGTPVHNEFVPEPSMLVLQSTAIAALASIAWRKGRTRRFSVRCERAGGGREEGTDPS